MIRKFTQYLRRISTFASYQKISCPYIMGANNIETLHQILESGEIMPFVEHEQLLAKCSPKEIKMYGLNFSNPCCSELLIFQMINPDLHELDGISCYQVLQTTKIIPILTSFNNGEDVTIYDNSYSNIDEDV